MFSIHFRKWCWLGPLMAALLLTGVGPVRGAEVVYITARHMTRAQVWLSFTNSGTQTGHYRATPSRVMMRMTYPGCLYGLYALLGTQEFVEYWGDKGFLSGNQKAEATMHSTGEGLLVLTNVGGEKWVSVTGPRKPTDDVIPMIYDIENSPEADWGIRTVVPQRGVKVGMDTANWWPGAASQAGADPATASPYEIHNYDYGIYPPVQNTAESVHISQWKTKHDVVVTRKALSWSQQDLDDGFIVELEFHNQGGKQLDNTYLGFMNAFYVNNAGTAFRWAHEGGLITYLRPGGLDDWYKYSESPGFQPNPLSGLTPADFAGKYLTYQYDGNSPDSFEEDTGDPYIRNNEATAFPGSTSRPEGMPIAPAYLGMAPLAFRNSGASHVFNAADQAKGYVDPIGDKPVLSHWYQAYGRGNIDDPTRGALGPAEIYDFFLTPTMEDPTEEKMVWHDQVYGPYNLAPGDKAKIVMAYVLGSAAEFDIDSRTGYARDITSWSWDVGIIDDNARKALLAKGEVALLRHLSHAQFAYDNEYHIPNSPPDVDFTARGNEAAQIQLSWTDAAEKAINPDYGEPDVAAYRVYRSTSQEYGPWEFLDEIPAGSSTGGRYQYDDTTSLAGFQFWYNVRSVAKPHADWSEGARTLTDLPEGVREHVTKGIEGGWSAPEQRMITAQSPTLAAGPKTDQLEQEILAVPNPFSLGDADRNYQGTKKLRFVGVPWKCTISIFSVSGDKVGVIEHDSPGVGEANWLLKGRFLTSEATSGLYFFVVESKVPGSEGKRARGAFVIHR